MGGKTMLKPEQVQIGKVFRYHSVIGRPECVPVRITAEPWELGDGSWICKAENLWTGAVVRPSIKALSVGETNYGPI